MRLEQPADPIRYCPAIMSRTIGEFNHPEQAGNGCLSGLFICFASVTGRSVATARHLQLYSLHIPVPVTVTNHAATGAGACILWHVGAPDSGHHS